ncbi:MAG: CRTAC1 family protein, partial [bacterium]|nr:CRTAC1 family protein [bacterium]
LQSLAYLRVGEQSGGATPAHGWLFPMAIAGGPAFDGGTRAAIDGYSTNLRNQPDDLATRWLLNICYMALGVYPQGVPPQWRLPPEIFASADDAGFFADVAPAAGVDVRGHAGGSVMDDFDGDGLLDIITSSRGLRDQLRFFHNDGDGTFGDWSERAGLLGQLGGLNLSHADYDNDGDADLTVWRGAWMGEAGRHPNSLLQNLGGGRFDDVTEQAGLLSFHPTHAGAWGDYDNDGWLDLFVGNESSPAPKPPHANQLYHNEGDGRFTEVGVPLGFSGVSFVKGLTLGDIDNDGQIDVYLSNLNGDNALYHNDGAEAETRFSEISAAAGVRAPYVSFPTWFWDYDNDGWQDILVAGFDMAELGDMAAIYLAQPFGAEYPRLYRNRGDGTFEQVAERVGLDRIILPMGANFGDIDNDGWLDAYFGTGMPDMRSLLPNRMVRNDQGRRFLDITTSGGFGTLQKGHGISFGDIDHDGDQDIYQVLGAAFEGDVANNVLLENPGHGNHWLSLKLEGVTSNRDAIGARIHVRTRLANGDSQDIHVTVGHGGSFGSSPLRAEIGLGQAVQIDFVDVIWPGDNHVQHVAGLVPDHAYHLLQGKPATELTLHRFDLSP